MTVITDEIDGSNVEMIIETSHDAEGNEAICDCTVTTVENEDGTITVQ